ncbi:hypothetical protein [Pseudobacteroides cellulosolvens]|uniref:Uncharacterized protein n=1 Tax=Pseudobacteroides cellulosolvens ATCC 35603 = DSM 2933 TaxID=398512 RepID=A0A0L6JTR9_9FIRM|nr:hypothetical protein [Pseudobacteroides cellulosolvens]KNY29231.1 hypothetical protein Bccel_4505 [Pseudobacteroides cellulosolvens ATCC 35603 = DSM 2933]
MKRLSAFLSFVILLTSLIGHQGISEHQASHIDVGERATIDAAFETLEMAIKNTGRNPSTINTNSRTQLKVRFGS